MANIDSILFLEKVVGLRRTGRIWVGAARTALARALEHEWNLGSTMGLTVPAAWSLTNRCFKIGENGRKGKAVADDIVRIDSVFKEIQALFKEIDLGTPMDTSNCSTYGHPKCSRQNGGNCRVVGECRLDFVE